MSYERRQEAIVALEKMKAKTLLPLIAWSCELGQQDHLSVINFGKEMVPVPVSKKVLSLLFVKFLGVLMILNIRTYCWWKSCRHFTKSPMMDKWESGDFEMQKIYRSHPQLSWRLYFPRW